MGESDMAFHEMYRRWKTRPFAILEAEGRSEAVETAARTGIDLTYADFRGLFAPGCFLPGADLRGADLTGADLSGGYLRKADLRSSILVGANLAGARIREADLRHADLRKAVFTGADVRGIRLAGARMEGTTIDWRWSGFAVELLSRDRDCRGDALRLVAELAFDDDRRPFGWLRTLLRDAASLEWALGVLGRAIAPRDNAPDLLRRLTADAVVDSVVPLAPQQHWVRRARSA
jgi:hypothetical protein